MTSYPLEDLDPNTRRFLQLCLRSHWDPDALTQARALNAGGPLDWQTLLACVGGDGLAPFLCHCVRGQNLVPPTVEQRLEQSYQDSALRYAVFSVELGRVLDHLTRAGLPVIVLKGPVLAETAYENAALRPMTDLDLLVRFDDVEAARPSLHSLGYQWQKVEPRTGLTMAFESEMRLVRPDRPEMAVELHWHLLDAPFYQRQIDEDWLWQTAQPVRLAGQQALALGQEANLLYLCAHAALHHRRGGWRWLLDIALVLLHGSTSLHWPLLEEKAMAFSLVSPLQMTLETLVTDWGVPLPSERLRSVLALPVSQEEDQVVTMLRSGERPVIQRLWTDLVGLASWRARAQYAAAQLFPSVPYMRQRYDLSHAFLVPIAYPYRWLLGLREWVTRSRPPSEQADG